MNIDLKRINMLASWGLYVLFFIYLISYFYSSDVINLLNAALFLLGACMLVCFNNLKDYLIHLFFYVTIFVFLLSRPTIDYYRDGFLPYYTKDAYEFALGLIIIAICSLAVGGFIADRFYRKKNITAYAYDINYIETLRKIAFFGFLGTYPFSLIMNVEKVLFKLKVDDYYVYYATFESQLPSIVQYLGNFSFFIFLLYLATMPKKIYATLALGMYVFSNFVILFTGTRNPFVLSLIFSMIYYLMRSNSDKEKWFGTKEKILSSLASVPLVIAMAIINYIRDGEKIGKFNFMDTIVDFLYNQGTSFNVITWGYMHRDDLPIKSFTNYSFGSIVDYFYRGKIGNLLFSSVDISATERVKIALENNSLAHSLTYIVYPDSYVAGYGIGDAYMLGNYIDFGYIGLIILNLILGFVFIYILKVLHIGKIVPSTIVLLILSELFFTPRGSYSASIALAFSLPFWFIVIVFVISANFLKKKNTYILRR